MAITVPDAPTRHGDLVRIRREIRTSLGMRILSLPDAKDLCRHIAWTCFELASFAELVEDGRLGVICRNVLSRLLKHVSSEEPFQAFLREVMEFDEIPFCRMRSGHLRRQLGGHVRRSGRLHRGMEESGRGSRHPRRRACGQAACKLTK